MRKFGYGDLQEEEEPHGVEMDERRHLVPGMDREYDEDVAQDVGRTPPSEHVQNVATGVSAVASGGKYAQYLSDASSVARASEMAPMVGGAVGTAGSLFNAGLAVHRIRNANDRRGDRRMLGAQAVSETGSALTSAAATVGAGLKFAGSVAPAVGTASGVGALITGPADMIRGTVGGLAAHRRARQLSDLQRRQPEVGSAQHVAAGFAKDVQKTKRVANAGTALKGALAVGGGIALLAGAGPVGWGLLGAGALVAGGVAAYKMYRKGKIGDKLMKDHANSQFVPDEQYIKANKPFYKTRAQFVHDTARDRIAAHLAEGGREEAFPKDMLRLLGLKKNAQAQEIKQGLSA